MSPRCVLIVEDEALVRMFAVDALDVLGFAVVEAATAAEALDRLRGEAAIDAAIIDLGLPDSPGDRLVAEIRSFRVDLPVVIASGLSHAEIAARFPGDPAVCFLSKPYQLEQLSKALAEAGLL